MSSVTSGARTGPHVMDVELQRFGWRVWHLDGSRLWPPIHRGRIRFGKRVVESVCQHRQDPLALAPDCGCGIYFEGLDRAIQRWRREADRIGAENVALTFGAAVGDVAPDPRLPDDAFRSPRHAILAILVPPGSAAAGPLRKRFGVNVHMKKMSRAAMRDVRDAVRSDLEVAAAADCARRLGARKVHACAADAVIGDGGEVDSFTQLQPRMSTLKRQRSA